MSSVQSITPETAPVETAKVLDFQAIVKEATRDAAKRYFHQLLSSNCSGRDMLKALQSKELEPFLDDFTVQVHSRTSASPAPMPTTTGKRRGRPPGSGKKAAAPKVTGTAKPGAKTYTVFTHEQKKAMREQIYAMVSANPGNVSTPEIIAAVQKSHATVKNYTVVGLVKDLVKGKHLKEIPGKPIKYKIGARPL